MINIGFDEAHRLASVGSLVAPLKRGFVSVVTNPANVHYDLATGVENEMLVIKSAWRAGGVIGVKILTVFSRNTSRGLPSIAGAYVLLSGDTGQTLAVIDGRALTLLRTAAVSAMAADLLAPANPEVLLMVGTGALSPYLIEGHAAVRNYQSILVWGRDPGKAGTIARALAAEGWPIGVAADLQTSVRAADVISCATMAAQPLIEGAWLKPCAHLDLVGSFTPTMQEADSECFRGATVIVDTRGALEESGDLIEPLARGVITPDQISLLKELIEVPAPRARRTVFKSVGVALADLAVAEELVARHAGA